MFIFKCYFGQTFTNSNDDQTTHPLAAVTTLEEMEFSVYPNPFSGNLYITSHADVIQKAVFYNITGERVKEMNVDNQQPIDVSVLPAGMYVVRLINADNLCVGQTRVVKN